MSPETNKMINVPNTITLLRIICVPVFLSLLADGDYRLGLIVFVIAGATGLVRPSDLGVRLSMMAGIVGPQELTTATGVARTTSDFARVGGALTGAGMFAAFGIGNAYIVVVSLYVLGLLFTAAIPRASLAAEPAIAPAGGALFALRLPLA